MIEFCILVLSIGPTYGNLTVTLTTDAGFEYGENIQNSYFGGFDAAHVASVQLQS